MKRIIYVGENYRAVTEDGMLTEYIPVDSSDQYGVILLGKTDRLMPGIQSAFVDIGRKKDGFLPLDENSGSFTGKSVKSGEWYILQIKKEETGNKGAYLTRDVTIPGKYIILMPMNRYIGVSSKISDEMVRGKMRRYGENIAAGQYGLILRNAAAEANEDEIREEASELYTLWKETEQKAYTDRKPGKVLYSSDPTERLKEDYAADGIDEIIRTDQTDSGILKQLRQCMERTIHLPGGGNIVIDKCEAMTVIDVNTASSVQHESKEKTILETNLEACRVIVQQVRLRNLNGIIVIDFIDMDKETDRNEVACELKELFRHDRIKTVIHGWTSLGLMEITRKRTRQSVLCRTEIQEEEEK